MIVHLECLYSSLVLLTIVQNNKKFNSAALARDSVSVCEERNIEDLIINNTFYNKVKDGDSDQDSCRLLLRRSMMTNVQERWHCGTLEEDAA